MSTTADVADNEMICEKLLGWKLSDFQDTPAQSGDAGRLWITSDGTTRRTQNFRCWVSAGLILDSLSAKNLCHYVDRLRAGGYRAYIDVVGRDYFSPSAPLAIRSVAIAYARSLT